MKIIIVVLIASATVNASIRSRCESDAAGLERLSAFEQIGANSPYVMSRSAAATVVSALDQYSTFKTTRYYSSNLRYFVLVTSTRQATLYRADRRARKIWTKPLPALPGRLLVRNDGGCVVIVDRYYGNAGNPNTPVVTLLGSKGTLLAKYSLGQVADLSRVIRTPSQAEWLDGANFSSDESELIIQTVIAKREQAGCSRINSLEEADECAKSVPYERLSISTDSGKLISRTNINVPPTASNN